MMTEAAYHPTQVMPRPLAQAVDDLSYWFVIGGQAMRCFAPYGSSRDVDFGVAETADLGSLIDQLMASGAVELLEHGEDTVHLRWNGIKVSIFVLPRLVPYVEDQHLNITAILATKLHAILDRGTRRDFFDLYVTLQQQRLGVIECLRAIRTVYQQEVDDGPLLRALCYFEDAEREAALPNEGPEDWRNVKEFFMTRVGNLLMPPDPPLAIQAVVVDVED